MYRVRCKVFTALICCVILISCGDPNNSQQSSEVTFIGPLNSSVSSTLTYGAIYYVISDSNGGYRGTYELDATNSSISSNIPNGTYKFYALGASAYSSSDSTLGFNPTSIYCGGGTSVTLDGNPVSVQTNLSSSNCYSSTTYSGDYTYSSSRALAVSFCGSSGFSSISGYEDTCPSVWTSTNTSFEFGFLLQGTNFSGSNSPTSASGLFTNCSTVTSSTSGANINWAAFGQSGTASSPLSIGIVVYSSSNCTGSVYKTYVFPTGLGSDVSPSGSAKIYSTSSAAKLFLSE